MKLLKVLNKDLKSPYQNFKFEIGKKYHCKDFDESDKECSNGFYATDIDGLPYAYNIHRKVFECEVWGKSKEFDIYKRRYENMKLIREVNKKKLVKLAKPRDLILGYKLSEVINPINPLLIQRGDITDKELELLKQWGSVRDSVWGSVRGSVMDSVLDSVLDSVRDSVWGSVWDSMFGYISSLFPNIENWKYITHKKGVNPFRCGINLWKSGLVPSYDGMTWRLHSGTDAKVVYEERSKK